MIKISKIHGRVLRRKQQGFINLPLLMSGGGYQIQRSLRFRASAAPYLSKAVTVPGNQTTFTYSFWVKRGAIQPFGLFSTQSDIGAPPFARIWFDPNGNLQVTETTTGSVLLYDLVVRAKFADPTAWCHIIVAYDSTASVASDRIKIYSNGTQLTSLLTATYPSLNQTSGLRATTTQLIGRLALNETQYCLDGYLSEVNFIDGQALTPSSFGKIDAATGQWVAKKYQGTYGTNGFYLDFKDGTSLSTLGSDKSGNGNSWTLNNISLTPGVTYDWMEDTPTNNFCVLNPLDSPTPSGVTESNLRWYSAISSWQNTRASMAISSGKWYWEVTCSNVSPGLTNLMLGVDNFTITNVSGYPGSSSGSYGYVSENGQKFNNGLGAAYGASYGNNDVIGVALDLEAGTLTFFKNGVSQGTAFTGLAGIFVPSFGELGAILQANFGQRPFAYTPPTGFKTLCTKNLPTPTIKKPSTQFNIALDTGANIKAATEALFPSAQLMEWIKDRANSNNHQLMDTVRGTSAVLQPNTTNAETVYTTPAGNSVGWAWNLATPPVTNNTGSLSAQVSANAAAGISVMTANMAASGVQTVGHGLGIAPDMVMVMARATAGQGKAVYHRQGTTSAGYVILGNTDAYAASSNTWNNTDPDSSVITLGTGFNSGVFGATALIVAFAAIPGFSKFGRYTGNAAADGPFVYCGFRPRFVLFKKVTATSNWYVYDTARGTINVVTAGLFPNLPDAESATTGIDLLSNGFKFRAATDPNTAGDFLYAAFAESPFKYANAR